MPKSKSSTDSLNVFSYAFFKSLGEAEKPNVQPVQIPSVVRPEIRVAKKQTKQPFVSFLVFDVEATCVQGANFDYCHEIIEWPVVLLRWKHRTEDGRASELEVVDEFRTFVRPTFRPVLSAFCTSLTGIAQSDVDTAPTFVEMLPQFKTWMVKHGLICPDTEKRLQRFTWCTDGPFDIRDFVVKQCFISNIPIPEWLRSDVTDVRQLVTLWLQNRDSATKVEQPSYRTHRSHKRPSLNLTSQLKALSLAPFEGRQHSGIDDTRNIARIVTELARRGVRLEPNLYINPGRRWNWMGSRRGEVLEDFL
ncbi:hypothetical protein SISNIDRAFT_403605 [Sistotremastrum niveocremeum HHB9708]|uniref:Exonuclease domain-containing protein n=1 Tax=Sistotremastrum niveocremeum HHB9708 TaxID=1314777 RepID=A0A165AG89_9AGAM|nr:hypothetical protein SISNIDRAFT_403605 [Sistotremastrum niveocremeum HHB9708]